MSEKPIPTPIVVLALLFAANFGVFIVCRAAGWPLWVAITGCVLINGGLIAVGMSLLVKGSRP